MGKGQDEGLDVMMQRTPESKHGKSTWGLEIIDTFTTDHICFCYQYALELFGTENLKTVRKNLYLLLAMLAHSYVSLSAFFFFKESEHEQGGMAEG